jgi:hypothetical protein
MAAEFDVPVVLMAFNRPQHTRAVFDRIAAIRPTRLFAIADGPRPDRPDDVRKCGETRAVLDRVNWPCDLHTNFSDTNLGCAARISSGLDWVFDQVERAIILEDDCIPDPSFFPFCAELLERFADDPRVRTISGSSFLFGKTRTHWSYRFSIFHDIWGWATWRRSWQRVDMAMAYWPQVRDEGWLFDMVGIDRSHAKFWATRFNRAYERRIDSWAYPYLFSCWLDHSLAIAPNRNLVSNIGVGNGATHTRKPALYLRCPTDRMSFPLVHPPFMVCDQLSDRETFKRRLVAEEPPLLRKIARWVYNLFASEKRGPNPVRLVQGRLVERRFQSLDTRLARMSFSSHPQAERE